MTTAVNVKKFHEYDYSYQWILDLIEVEVRENWLAQRVTPQLRHLLWALGQMEIPWDHRSDVRKRLLYISWSVYTPHRGITNYVRLMAERY